MCVLITRSIITAPLSTKRSRRVASEEFDAALKRMLFAVILTPHPVGEFLFITKRGALFFVCYC